MSDSSPSVDTLRSVLGSVTDPEFDRSLTELGMVSDVTIEGETPHITIELPTPAYPNRDRIGERIQAALREKSIAAEPNIEYVINTRGKNSGGKIGLRVKNVIAVGSGKGGVGKSTLAAGIAFGLKEHGATVGLMDADVYGPSLPHMLGASGQPLVVEHQSPDGQKVQKIQPIEANGVKVISMGFFVDPDKAVVWRGPMLHKALTQFLQDTDWGELDYLVIDLPPGTGDVSLTLSQLLGLAGAVIVCTPQQVALLDAVKAINMYEQVKVPILGLVENMSGDIFGRGGAKAKAEELNIPFLGEVPIGADIRIKGDSGNIADLLTTEGPARDALLHVSERVAIQIAKELLTSPELPELEVL